MSSKYMESVWSKLPTDILEVVSKKITTIEDYLRLRTLCVPWRSALSPAPRYLPPQLPWFMLPYNPHSKEDNFACLRSFYDISTGRIRQINLPETCGKQYCGSSRGWLVLQDGPEFSLLNPITRVQMQLPSLKVLPTILRVSGMESEKIRSQLDVWLNRYNIKEATDPIMERFILTSSPLDPDCIIMALFKNNWRLAFYRIGDESWTLFEVPGPLTLILDATYHNGLFYCLVFGDELRVYDLKGTICEVSKINKPLQGGHYHLIEGEVDELLLVAQPWVPYIPFKSHKFSIYKLGIGEGKDRADWIEVRGIGEKMYFVCDGIEQCFVFPKNNLQMSVLGPNLLCCAYPIIVPRRNREGFLVWRPQDNFVYYISELVKSFSSYPNIYSHALWVTPSFY